MEWYYILLIVLASLLVLFIGFVFLVSFVVVKMLVHPKRYSREEQNQYNIKNNFNKGTEVLKREDIVFHMDDGYLIHGDYNLIPGSKKFCILAHGHATTREGALRYSLVFNELGYSTIIYDQRSHGDNVHKNVTMGVRESKDLALIIDQVYEKFGKDIILGLQGVSMGAATVLLSTQYQQKVAFIVSDCAYGKISNVIIDILRRYHINGAFFLPFINMITKCFYHFSLKEAAPINYIEKNKIPILFIHGDKDSFVNVSNVYGLYSKAKCRKKLVVFKDAEHASSITVDRDKYKSSIAEFLNMKEE